MGKPTILHPLSPVPFWALLVAALLLSPGGVIPTLGKQSDNKLEGKPNLFKLSDVDVKALTSYGCKGLNNKNYHPCPVSGTCHSCDDTNSCAAKTPESCDAESTIGTAACQQGSRCGMNVIVQFAQGGINGCNKGPGYGSSQGSVSSSQNSQSQYYCAATSTDAKGCCKLCKEAANGAPLKADFKCKSWLFLTPNSAKENPRCNASSTPKYITQDGDSAFVVTPYYGGCGWCFLLPREECGVECAAEGLSEKEKNNLYWGLYGRQGCADGKNDPHFTGADGARFEFNGIPDKSFCLVSDKDIHINMRMHGYLDHRTVGASILKNGKAVRTWMRELGFVWNKDGEKHTLLLGARAGPEQEYGEGFLAKVEHDGVAFPKLKVGETMSTESGLTLTFTGVEKRGPYDVEHYKLSIAGVLALDLKIRLAHPLLQTPEDAEAHFNIMFDALMQTDTIHGVVGQTYRSGRTVKALEYRALSALLGHPMAADGESGLGYLDGSTEDYVSSDVLAPDCKFSAFSSA